LNIPAFRTLVDSIPDKQKRYVSKFYYLTAARANEGAHKGTEEYLYEKRTQMKCSKCECKSPSERFCKCKDHLHESIVHEGKFLHTKPWGPLRKDVEYDVYEGTEVMTIKTKVLKRKEKPDEDLVYRRTALPLNDFEPWAKELSAEYDKLTPNEPLVDIDRMAVATMFREFGLRDFVMSDLDKTKPIKNPLRHERISHLLGYYHMTPVQAITFIGWSAAAQLKMPQEINTYLSLRWSEYFPALLKPVAREHVPTPEIPLVIQQMI
jgi:hypothetical protein